MYAILDVFTGELVCSYGTHPTKPALINPFVARVLNLTQYQRVVVSESRQALERLLTGTQFQTHFDNFTNQFCIIECPDIDIPHLVVYDEIR